MGELFWGKINFFFFSNLINSIFSIFQCTHKDVEAAPSHFQSIQMIHMPGIVFFIIFFFFLVIMHNKEAMSTDSLSFVVGRKDDSSARIN